MVTFELPGLAPLELASVVLDLNGTLSDHGSLIDGVAQRLAQLSLSCAVHVLSADTRGTAEHLLHNLPVALERVTRGSEKEAFVRRLGPERTAAIGNGRNDEAMLRLAALGVAVIGPEGATSAAILAADIVCLSIADALDLLLDDQALPSTLHP